MALAKDNHQIPSSRCFYENMLDVGSSIQQFPQIISPYTYDEYDQHQYGDDGLESPNNSNNNNNNTNKVMISPTNHVISNNSPTISNSSTSANSSNNGLTINHHNTTTSNNFHQSHEEAHSLINFKPGFGSFMDSGNNNNGSLLSFRNENNQFQLENNYHNNYPMWEGNYQQQQQRQQSPNRYQLKEMKNCTSNTSLLEEVSHLRTSISDYNQDLGANDWIYAEANVIDPPQESAAQQTRFDKKRANMEEESMQPPKKKCTANTSKKPKFVSKLKDPQSVAAKNRRERISERLKILQDLVPNGSKVDLVTMLEKAIGYVKFLQLQLKVLATDEFWPAAGGNAPDISQVKEAIDAILSSQRSSEGTTSSTSK